jgi:DNA-binding transcriptional MerR regulator
MNTAFTNNEKQEWARLMYMKEEKNTDEVAAITGLDPAIIRTWAAEGCWQEVRRTMATSRHYQLEKLYELLEQLTGKMNATEEINSKDADLLVKYTTAIKNLDLDTGIPQVVEVATLFTTWLRKHDTDQARNIAMQFDAFIKHRLQLQSGQAA